MTQKTTKPKAIKQDQKILVLGATGKTGNATALQLLEKGIPVRAFVHRIDERSEKLKEAGAEIFQGQMSNFEDISAALVDVKKAYFVAPWIPEQLHLAMTFAVAAAQSELQLIVTITQWLGQPQHPSLAIRHSYLTDNVFDMIPGVDVVKINTGWFANNYLQPEILAIISQLGMFPFPLGNGKTAPISNEDLGRVITAALLNPKPYVGKTIRPAGPELLSPTDLVETFARVVGRPVKYDNISEKLFLKALQFMKMPTHLQAQLRHYVEDYRRGGFELGAPNNVVFEMTGQAPEDFETIVHRYMAGNENTRPTLGNKLKAFKGFIKLILTKPIDLERYERESSFPTVKNPKFALDYKPWLETHAGQHAVKSN